MKILVIGFGFLGAPIVKRLQEDGHELLVMTRVSNSTYPSNQIIGDFFDDHDVSAALSWGPQVVIQTAWVTKQGVYLEDSSNSKYARSTIRLAQKIVDLRIQHLIILGTCAEYGSQTVPVAAGRTELNPQSFYAEQKMMTLMEVKRILSNSNSRLTWARIFYPYGPNQDKARLIPYLIKSIEEEKVVHLKNASSVLDWITTRDVSSAISWITSHETPSEVDIGTGIGHSSIELYEHLKLIMDKKYQALPLISQPTNAGGVMIVDRNSPLFLSGWRPQDSLDLGLKWVLKK